MVQSIRSQFPYFSARFEGRVPVMYLDTHQDPKTGAPAPLVTIAIGNMIEPVSEALALPFVLRSTGLRATQAEILNEWNRVKMLKSHWKDHTSFWISSAVLQLNAPDIDALVLRKLDEFDAGLSIFPEFAKRETWPADGHLGLLSMAWAMGDGDFAEFPHFRAAASAGDFAGMSSQCKMDDSHNDGLKPRNAANKLLFDNAAAVIKKGLDPSKLYYPGLLA